MKILFLVHISGETELKNKKVKKMTKDALNYLDSRNSFWEQQTPHHIREKSLILPNRDNGQKPPPTQAMYAFMVKEMMRINTSRALFLCEINNNYHDHPHPYHDHYYHHYSDHHRNYGVH